MSEIASPGQLRAAFLRWVLFIVPGIMFLGYFSALLSGSSGGNPWYLDLAKPELTPSPAAFRIAWILLYFIMGIALTLVVTARGATGRGLAIGLFVLQLVLGLAWSPLFFGLHRISAALGLMAAIDVVVFLTIVLFRKVRPLAAWLLLPYLGWVLFATLLNWQFLVANPGA